MVLKHIFCVGFGELGYYYTPKKINAVLNTTPSPNPAYSTGHHNTTLVIKRLMILFDIWNVFITISYLPPITIYLPSHLQSTTLISCTLTNQNVAQ